MQLGYTYPRRKKLLEELTATSSGKTYPVTFQGRLNHFNIYAVSIDLPKYRLNNGRTYAAQAEYLSKHRDLSGDFFTADPELDDAIKAQHEILKVMIHDKDLLNYFTTNEQTEPLILTHDGFVLNGNRRLCAMRELYASDKAKFRRFEHIDVVVLPPCEDRDIDELEAKLQIHKDIKADYAWITFALMLRRRQSEHGYDTHALADLYEIKPTEVSELIDMLAYAEEYLDQRGLTGHYHLVEKDEYAFQQIRKKRNSFSSEPEKELFEKLAYALIDNPEGGRLYEMIPDTATYINNVIETIKDEIEIPDDFLKAPSKDKDEDILGGRKEETPAELGAIIRMLDDESHRKPIREVVTDVVTGERAKAREGKRKNFVLVQVKKANAALADALNAISEETTKDGISEQLDAVDDTAKKLRDWLDA